MMRLGLVTAVAVLLGLGAPDLPATDRREFRLHSAGPVRGRSIGDFDGDGLLDLLVISERHFDVFLQRAEGFRSDPDQSGTFDPRAHLFEVGDVDGDGRDDLVLLTPSGLSTMRMVEGKFPARGTPLLEEPSIFAGQSPEVMREKDLMRDLDGDGKLDLILPHAGGVRIYRTGESGAFEMTDDIHVPVGALLRPGWDRVGTEVIGAFWLPELHLGDYDGDGRVDLGVMHDGSLRVHSMDESGRFPAEPTREIPIRLPQQGGGDPEGGGTGGTFNIDYELPLQVRDINGDRFPDFVTTHVGRGATNIFLGSPGRTDLRTPSQIVRVKGFSFLTFVHDLDGDGLEDLVIGSIPKFGLWGAMKIFVTRSVKADAHVFYNRGRKLYPLVPDYQRQFDVPILARQGEAGGGLGTTIIVTAKGDMNGDGLNDMVVKISEDRLGVFAGVKRAGFTEEPTETIPLLPPDEDRFRMVTPFADDLNADGRDDIVLLYLGWDRDDDRVTVILSPGKK